MRSVSYMPAFPEERNVKCYGAEVLQCMPAALSSQLIVKARNRSAETALIVFSPRSCGLGRDLIAALPVRRNEP